MDVNGLYKTSLTTWWTTRTDEKDGSSSTEFLLQVFFIQIDDNTFQDSAVQIKPIQFFLIFTSENSNLVVYRMYSYVSVLGIISNLFEKALVISDQTKQHRFILTFP